MFLLILEREEGVVGEREQWEEERGEEEGGRKGEISI